MREDYVWDKSGDAEPDLVALERTLGALRHDQPMGTLPSGTFQRAPISKPGWAKPIVLGALLSSSLTVLLIWLFLQLGGSAAAPASVPPNTPEPASMGPAPVAAPAPKQTKPEHDPKEVDQLRKDLQTTLDRLDVIVRRLEELEKTQAEREAQAKAAPKLEPPSRPDPLEDVLRKPRRKPDYPVDCILDPDQCKPVDPSLPDKLTSTDIKDGVRPHKAAAKACGAKHGASAGEKLVVKLSIAGRTGRVTTSKAMGRHAGTLLGECAAKALGKAKFRRFRRDSLGVQYPIRF